ncbi:MAG: cell division protein FtsL [bacterium]|nr:cell division protein FtsL [bacterium]
MEAYRARMRKWVTIRRKWERLPSPAWAAGCILLVAVSALFVVWPHLEIVKLGYRLTRLETERARLLEAQRILRVEAATLRQLGRIEAISRGRLGMVFPRPEQVIYVKIIPGSLGDR